jgi:hypothetical protein
MAEQGPIRRRRYELTGPQPPMTWCQRRDLPGVKALVGYPEQRVLSALRAYDRNLELLFDRYCGPNGAWHVYRVTRRGASPAYDGLKLEATLLKDMTKAFSETEPITAAAMGMHLIEWLKATDKTKGGTLDPKRADTLLQQRDDAQYAALEAAKKKEARDAMEYAKREMKHALRTSESWDRGRRGERKSSSPKPVTPGVPG